MVGKIGIGVISSLFAATLLTAQPPTASREVLLRETPRAGQQFRVRTRGDLVGELNLPPQSDPKRPAGPKTLKLKGSSVTEYDETWLEVADGEVAKCLRAYRTHTFERLLGEQRQEHALRPEARRVVLIPGPRGKLIFSPDGPLTLGEIETTRLDVFSRGLLGLLPAQPVVVGKTWIAGRAALAELLDLEIEGGEVSGRLLAVETRGNEEVAVFSFSGTVQGKSPDGPARQKVQGTGGFNLSQGILCELSLSAHHVMLDAEGKEAGRIEGRFVLTRRPTQEPSLLPDALAKVPLEPTAGTTAILFDEPAMGVRLVHPRHWIVKQADARQILLDEDGGAGLLFTLESLRNLPTAASFEKEARAALAKQKVTLTHATPIRRLAGEPHSIEHFQFDATTPEMKRLRLDYFVLKQAAGGATVAANCQATRAEEVGPEVEQIVRSLRLIPPKK